MLQVAPYTNLRYRHIRLELSSARQQACRDLLWSDSKQQQSRSEAAQKGQKGYPGLVREAAAGMQAAWKTGGARIATLLLLGLLVLVGQSVWAAGYRPPRSLGSWSLTRDRRISESPTTPSDAAPGSTAAAAAAAAPKPAEAVQLSPAEQDYWDAAAAKDKASKAAAPGAAAAATPASDPTAAKLQASEQQSVQDLQKEQELEKQSAAEADARAAQDFAAVQGPDGEPDIHIEDWEDAGGSPEEAGQRPTATQAASQLPPAAASKPAAAAAAAPAATPPAAAPAAAAPAAAAVAASPLQGMPYNLQDLPDADALFKAHTQWQQKILQEKKKGVQAIRVNTGEGHGLGNRMPAIGTGYILAVLTGRLFFLHSTVHDHLEFPLPCVWKDHESLYEGVDACNLGHFAKFVNPDLKFCGPPGTGQDRTATLLVQDCQFDYMVPMLQINPTFKPFFDKFFPDSEIYTRVARYLFKPKPVMLEAMKPYEELSKNCLVGMHLRTRKAGTAAPPEQFAAIARAIAVARPGNVFVAADADVFKQIQDNLPGREVWWNKKSIAEQKAGNKTHAGNPGTELSAITDLWLLSKCKNVILTPASSMGGLAAAIGGTLPVFANAGPHTDPFINPWFWKALTSEPCFVKVAEVHKQNTELAQRFRKEHPLYVYHSQCHYAADAVGFRPASWECTANDCRESRR